MEMVKGSSGKFSFTVYSYWSGNPATSVIADVTSSTTNFYLKNSENDSDASAILTVSGSVIDGPNGRIDIVLTAANTNSLTYKKLVYEIVTKLSNGDFIRTGVRPFIINPNVLKTLF